MKTKILGSILMLSLATAVLGAQEKQAPKQDQAAPPAAEAQGFPHTYKISQEEKDRKNAVRFTDLSVDRGKKLYGSHCSMCHGEKGDGKGDLAEEMKIQPPDLTNHELPTKRTDGELFTIIGGGSDIMPGEKDRMPEKQRWQIVNYLRSLEGKTPAKATDEERASENTAIVSPH
jgi:mono/diheme cytochrome c family protein